MSAVAPAAPARPDAPDADTLVVADAGPVPPSGTAWSRVGPVKKVAVVLLVLVVGLNVVLAALDQVIGSDPGGPSGSTFSTGEDGIAAWADLLEGRGVAVSRLQTPLGEAALPPEATLVVMDPPEAPDAAAQAAVRAHVEAGGRLVAVGREATDLVAVATGSDPGWVGEGPTRPRSLTDAAATEGVGVLAGEGRGSYRTPEGLVALVGRGDQVVAVADGDVVGVADPTLLWNQNLAEADDAAFALALAGDGPVVFAEAEHGYGDAEGVGALPASWRRTGLALVVAALLGMWCAGQRLGPPERTERALAPPRAAYLDAMAAALSRVDGGRPPPGPPHPDRPHPPEDPHVR